MSNSKKMILNGRASVLCFLTTCRNTPVLEEIIEIATKHTKINAMSEPSEQVGFMDIYVDGSCDMDVYRDEFLRLLEIVKTPLNEPILPDDCPVHQGYMYVADGRPVQFIDGERMNAGLWKSLPDGLAVKEVRRCDIAGRMLRAAPIKTDNGLDVRKGTKFGVANHGPRKRHKTCKIRKVES